LAALVLPIAMDPKLTLSGATVIGVMPVPVRLADCGPLLALSTIVNVPVSGATLVGVNTTSTVQLAPPANVPDAGQVPPAWAKLPLTAMSVMVRGDA
jgi:hypothetical protein